MDTISELRDAVFGFRISQALHVTAALGISEQLADGPLDIATLAKRVDADADSLRRLMRAVAALGVFHEGDRDTFESTALSAALVPGHPSGVYESADNVGRPYFWNTWSELKHSIRTGENAFEHLNGHAVWTHREQHDDDGQAFDRAMTAQTAAVARAVAEAYDFASFRSVVDVGGNRGSLLAAVLRSAPSASGVLFDLPHVVAKAQERLIAEGIFDRCEIIGGSFFEEIPPGRDGYLLKSILHDWPDATCVEILGRCRQALSPNAKLLIVERLLGPPNTGLADKLSDLNMLVMPGGRERTADEFSSLLEAADLRLNRVIATATDFNVLEAVPR